MFNSRWLKNVTGGVVVTILALGYSISALGVVSGESRVFEDTSTEFLLLAQLDAPGSLRVLAPGESPPPPEPSPAGSVKWHPGHYAFVPEPADMPSMHSEIGHLSVVKGYQTRFYWDELETAKDQYDFSVIRNALAFAKSKNKLLVIQIQFKTFNDTKRVPQYLLKSEYDGGVYQSSSGGWNLRLWNPLVVERFEKFLGALGSSLDSDGTLSLVNLAESAAAAPSSSDPLYANWPLLSSEHAAGLAYVSGVMRKSFPTTPGIAYFNGGRTEANNFRDVALTSGVGLGGPDTYIGSYDYDLFLRYSYDLARELSSSVPVGFGVQWNNYVWVGASSKWAHPDGAVPVSDIYSFSKDTLRSNFMFWQKREPYWQEVMKLLTSLEKVGSESGGLIDSCPSLFKSCAR